MTIIIADDEDNLRLLIETTLEEPEVRLLQATTGTEALELAKSERPDLMILDWMMPQMSGIEVLHALRQDSSTTGIPVILLTGKGQEKDRAMGLAAGAQAYLVKPFSPLQLLKLVQEVLLRADRSMSEPR